jgi:hypothetical protein
MVYTDGMEELQISGKRYISSRRAAKDHKYHSDYIGQLVRAGKVSGQKVGRAWYVEAESLAVYLGKEGSTPAARISEVIEDKIQIQNPAIEEKAIPEIKPEVEVVETIVEPDIEIKKENMIDEDLYRIPIHGLAHAATRTMHAKKNNRLIYVDDDEPLLPRVASPTVRQGRALSHMEEVEATEEEYVEEKKVPLSLQKDKNKFYGQWGIVASLGIFSFVLVVGTSYFFTYSATVDKGEMSATVSLGVFNL